MGRNFSVRSFEESKAAAVKTRGNTHLGKKIRFVEREMILEVSVCVPNIYIF